MNMPRHLIIEQRKLRALKHIRQTDRLLTIDLDAAVATGAVVEPGALDYVNGMVVAAKKRL